MNSYIINWLNGKFDYSISTDYYEKIEIWKQWWQGFYEPFHKIVFDNGKKRRTRDMYTMKMAKKICEDWASILINDKTVIKLEDNYTSTWLQGENQLGGVLGENNFWEQANDLMERMMYSGTVALIVRLKNARLNSSQKLIPDPATRIDLNYISAERIIVLSSDNGVITEAAFCSDICIRGRNKLYLEIHRLENGEYIIENHIFGINSKQKNLLYEEDLPENVPKKLRTGSDKPWFSICKPAIVNTEDNSGGMGCAVFSNAIDNLKGVDIAYNNFNSDFWLGQKKVFINQNLIGETVDGERVVPDEVNQQLFYTVGISMSDNGESLVQEHNPDLRVTDNTAGIQAQLDYLSFKVGFGTKHYQFNAGAIVTATQYTGDKQDLIQNAHKHFIKVEAFLQQLVETLLYIGNSYIDSRIDPDTKVEILFDQSPLVDENAERQRDKDDVSAGLMLPWEYRVKWYGETEEEAKRILAENATDDELMGFEESEV